MVYSLYQIRLDEIWKDDRKKLKGEASNQVVCGEVGGSVRFLSGHVGTFLEAREGFLKLDAQYVLFLWRPIPNDPTYMINEAYLLHGDRVFPVDVNFGQGRFSGMPLDQFLKEVKSAIKSGADVP